MSVSEPWAAFRFEYVSGVVPIPTFEDGQYVMVYIVNCGEHEGIGRAYIYETKVMKNDSGNNVVAGGDVFSAGWAPTTKTDNGLYWVRILTTSADLVPSAFIGSGDLGSDATAKPTIDVYYAPGDFAVFPLHVRPVLPVVPTRPTASG
jgi:hypothetical protein